MTRAILLAAGQGSRLRPLTDDKPKCLVEYQGRPILEHILSVMGKCGIDDVVVVSGYRADSLVGYGTSRVVNEAYMTTNMVATLFCARDLLEGDVIISYTDIVYRERVLRSILDSDSEISVAFDQHWRSLWEARMDNPLSDAETFKLNEQGHILELGKKTDSYDDIEGQYLGLIRLQAGGCEIAKSHYDALDQTETYDGKSFANMYMTSFIQSLIDAGQPVMGVPIQGGWTEIDCPADLEYDLPQ